MLGNVNVNMLNVNFNPDPKTALRSLTPLRYQYEFKWDSQPFSFPGPFAARSESANRTLANLLPGTFAPGSKMQGANVPGSEYS